MAPSYKVRLGRLFFRYRSYLPLILPGLALVLFLLFPSSYLRYPGPLVRLPGCLLFFIAGVSIRAIAVGTTPRHTSGRNTATQIAETLNTTGIYHQMRNPLYFGNFLIWTSLFLYSGNLWLLLGGCLFFYVLYDAIIAAEEDFLSAKFGEAYLLWQARTPRFFPAIRPVQPSGIPFSLRSVLRREYSGWLSWCACMFLLEWGFHYFMHKPFSYPLLLALGIMVCFSLLCKILRKYTIVFSEPDRS